MVCAVAGRLPRSCALWLYLWPYGYVWLCLWPHSSHVWLYLWPHGCVRLYLWPYGYAWLYLWPRSHAWLYLWPFLPGSLAGLGALADAYGRMTHDTDSLVLSSLFVWINIVQGGVVVVASLLLNCSLAQVLKQSHACPILEEELRVVVQEQPKGPGPLPCLVVDIALDVIEGEFVGLHEVPAFVQVELVDALPRVEEGEAEEVVHGLYRSRVVSLAQPLVDAVPWLGHSLQVRYVRHGVVCEPGHRGDFVEVGSVRGVVLSLSFARCPSPPRRVMPVAPIPASLARDALALQVMLVVFVRVGSAPSHLLGSV